MSSGTTSLDQLPTNASNPQPPVQNNENIKIDNYGQQLQAEREELTNSSSSVNIDYTSQLTSVLKDATASGATVLPSRDIPLNTLNRQQDDAIKPDYLPKSKDDDYIGNILDKERVIHDNQKKLNQADNIDYIYQQIQIPLLLAILYFLFQLPIVRKNLLTFLPNLFNKDGTPTLSGYIFNSIMFAIIFSLLIKCFAHFQNLS